MSTITTDFAKKPHPKDLVLKRTVKAPRKLVFECLTSPEHLVHFWPPKPFTMHDVKIDLRAGGEWTYVFRSPEGQEHAARHTYLEIDSPQKLVMEAGVPGPGGKPFFKIRQTITLQEMGDETAMVFECKVLEANPGSDPFLAGMEQGTNMTLDQLVRYLESKKGKA
jgi:uncharacterized protein YndB with AHSA1/START domain